MSTLAELSLWGRTIGAVALKDGKQIASFEYAPEFVDSSIEVAPLLMPLNKRVYTFPQLPYATFHGLPGLLADALPDKFGNSLINAWLAGQGRNADTFNPVERLCYTGSRGMGAIEFSPVLGPDSGIGNQLQVDQLVSLASMVLRERNHFRTSMADAYHTHEGMTDILRVGTSAGGARAKAIVAWHPETNDVRSGQIVAESGYEYWLIKFDGVSGNRDKELDDPQGFGAIEYAYYHMAKNAGIKISECRLFEENNRRHFMTKRFDRLENGEKLHMQSLCAMAHFDFNLADGHSYEQAMLTIRQLGLPMQTLEQQFRRMVFNIIARNQDDHVKNIAFLMDKKGRWNLSPAYDLTYSYNPAGNWTSQHQMSMNGKRDNFTLDDFRACASAAGLKRGLYKTIIDEVRDIVSHWPTYADKVNVTPQLRDLIMKNLRIDL